MKVKALIYFAIITVALSCGSNSSNDAQVVSDQDTTAVVDSLAFYEKKLNADPDSPVIMYERAKYYVRHGDVEMAMADLEKVLAKDSSHMGAQKLYADINLAMLDLEKSKYHYEYILARDSTNSEALLGMAKIYAALSNFGKADYYISSSLRNNPYSPEPYFTRGLIYRTDYYQTGRESSWDIAKSSFQTAIEQDPDFYEAFIELGVMHAEKGDSIALEYYNSAIDIYPESIEAWYNKGYYYQSRGEVDNALNCYYTLKSIDSTWYSSYYNIGYIHLIMTEELDSAIYYFEKCTYWDPGNYAAFNNLGLAWEKKGDLNNARKYYHKAVEINPDFQLAKDNLNELDK
ncbi:MAG: tetratricopeptide repeat protein [Crocinitomicaceae bacterium]|nr:tetratricopeptide repeat protein [Crocinitomicaceae bacterium]